MGSLIMRVADEVQVPAGSALAVDRGLFARRVTEAVGGAARGRASTARRSRASPTDPVAIVATGPLTSEALAARDRRASWARTTSTSTTRSARWWRRRRIDFDQAFRASRYGKGGDDYVNCPLDRGASTAAFYEALTTRGVRRPSTTSSTSSSSRAACPSRSSPAAGRDTLLLRSHEAGGPRRPAHRAAARSRSCSSARTTWRPATSRWWASRPSSSGASRSASSG